MIMREIKVQMRKHWKDLSDDEKIKIGKVWKAQAKRIRKERLHYLIVENDLNPRKTKDDI